MKYKDLRKGEVFNIGNSPSYPKLKLDGSGYVDMRDEIVNKSGDTVQGRDVALMTTKEIAEQFDTSELSIIEWDLKLREKYL